MILPTSWPGSPVGTETERLKEQNKCIFLTYRAKPSFKCVFYKEKQLTFLYVCQSLPASSLIITSKLKDKCVKGEMEIITTSGQNHMSSFNQIYDVDRNILVAV